MLSLATPPAAASTLAPAADVGNSTSIATPADTAAVHYALEGALNTHDQEGVVAQFTADAHLTDGAVYLGSEGVRAWAREVLADDGWLDVQDAPALGPTSGQPLPGDWAVAPVTLSRVRYRRLQVDLQQATLVAIGTATTGMGNATAEELQKATLATLGTVFAQVDEVIQKISHARLPAAAAV